MAANALALSDPPAKDAEKEKAEMKLNIAAAEELDAVDAPKASLIKFALDIFFRVYLLFYVGMVAAMVIVSDNWWDPWPGVLFLSPICIGTLWLTPRMKEVYIKLYATKRVVKSDCDLGTKFLSSEK